MPTTVVKLTVPDRREPLVVKAVDLFAARWRDRTLVPLRENMKADGRPAWELAVGKTSQPGIRTAVTAAGLPLPQKPHSYSIVSKGRRLTIAGADGHGVLYGLGHLLRNLEFESRRVAPPSLKETRMPAVYNRGIYFATHFNNFYEAAPVEQVERYVEEMALWGFDLLAFWFDANWFPWGFWNDPASRGSQMINRIRRITAKGRSLGMKILSGSFANEGFANMTPPELRVDPSARHGGFYQDSQICPSKPGGLKLIMDARRKIMELVGPVDMFVYAPYDPGGCGCAQCSHEPGRWGKKFLEIGPAVTGVVREVNPQVRVLLATWLMDAKEKAMVYDLCERKADWFQGLLTSVEDVGAHPVDPRYLRMVLPEISMFNCYSESYGCNGANPAPARFAVDAPNVARAGCSTMIYSEGFYEDVNKAMYAGLLWNPDRKGAEVLAEYIRYYFGEENQARAGGLIRDLETTWGADALLKSELKTVADLAKQAQRLKARLPRHRDAQDRWRSLNDRAVMDLLMRQAQAWKELAVESRNLFNDSQYMPCGELRRRLNRFLGQLRRRRKLVESLFDAHWEYMRFYHFQKNIMIFLPDAVLGKYNLETLVDPLAEAVAIRDETRMRDAVCRAFKRWFWFNGIDAQYHFQ